MTVALQVKMNLSRTRCTLFNFVKIIGFCELRERRFLLFVCTISWGHLTCPLFFWAHVFNCGWPRPVSSRSAKQSGWKPPPRCQLLAGSKWVTISPSVPVYVAAPTTLPLPTYSSSTLLITRRTRRWGYKEQSKSQQRNDISQGWVFLKQRRA